MTVYRNLIVVLDRPQNPANIGAVIRAMANTGFSVLRLVNPAPFERADLLRYAHRCDDLVARLAVYTDLDAALADATFVVGTAALVHPDRPHTADLPSLADDLAARGLRAPIALLFGTEGDGLDRAALDRCQLLASLPVNPAYPALNLAQSVLLFLFATHMAARDPNHVFMPANQHPPPASQADLTRLFALIEELLFAADYFRYSPEAAMRGLRNIVYRAQLTNEESAMLMGMARKLLRTIQAGSDTPGQP